MSVGSRLSTAFAIYCDMAANDDGIRGACVTRQKACKELDVGYSTLVLWLKRGLLREVKVGRVRLIPTSEIERFVTEHLAGTAR